MLSSQLKTFIWEQFTTGINDANTSFYLTIGQTNIPNTALPDLSIAGQYSIWRNMLGGVLIMRTNMYFVIPKITWLYETVYDMYDITDPSLFDGTHNFYVLTSSNNLYECIFNNYGARSTIQPSSSNPYNITQTADGYIWKYILTLSDADINRFANIPYIPIKTLTVNNGSSQWDVQQNVVNGSIYAIELNNPGSNYTNNSNLIINIIGDGTLCSATGNINTTSQTVSSITITNPGYKYTKAQVSISGGGGSGATANTIIGPPGGYGADPLYEFGVSKCLFSLDLVGTVGGELPVDIIFNQIAIIRNPIAEYNKQIAANSSFSQTLDLYLTGTGVDFSQNEIVFQGSSLQSASFSGQVVNWNSQNNYLTLINIQGSPTPGILIGSNTLTSRFITNNYKNPDFVPFSGNIIFVDNITPVTRNSNQTDSVNILIGL